jgi:glycosyltransferase involved in cell wall biosynthesis
MKIVYNTDQIYKHGGIEKVMATKVNYFVNEPNYEVFIITTEQKNHSPCYPLDKRVKLVDLKVNYDRIQSYFSFKNIKKAFVHFIRQRRIYNIMQPDVIISPNYNFDHFWLPFIKPKKTKLWKEIHSSRFQEPLQRKQNGFFNWFHWKIQDWIETKYDKVIVLNIDEVNYRPHNNVVVLSNPVEPFAGSANLDNKKVMAAGRIAPVKGFDQLIQAWALVHKQYPDWELHIYGDTYGDTKEKLQNQINSMFLQDVIYIMPSVENLTQTMLNYSIFALTSETECFPMVLLEALSVGLPIVSYDCPNGPRNIIIEKKDGILVKKRSPETFSKAIITLIQNENLRKKMGTLAKENSKRFHTQKIMNEWKQVLDTI